MSSNPHDSLFRGIFEHPENARGELQHLLPAELSQRLDWSTLALEPGSFVDEGGRNSHSDLLFSIKLDVDPDTLSLMADFVPRFRTLVDDLTATSDEELLRRAGTEAALITVSCLKNCRDTDAFLRALARWDTLLRDLAAAENGRSAFLLILRYILDVHQVQPDVILSRLTETVTKEQQEAMASAAEQLIARGEARGVARGRAEGEVIALRSVLVRQLQRRFGALPDDMLARIESAEHAELDAWTDRVITAATLAEVLAPVTASHD
ncbi:MAG: Rpn family recombination-promoting nuclease/putative transposase [Polyangiaceae bacterium]